MQQVSVFLRRTGQLTSNRRNVLQNTHGKGLPGNLLVTTDA